LLPAPAGLFNMIENTLHFYARRWLTIGLVLLLGFSRAGAQEIMDAPSARLLTKFHFQLLSGGIIVLQGGIDTFPDTLNFILDTGSGGISLDSTTCDYLRLKRTPSDRTIRGIGGVKQVEFAKGHALKLPNLSVNELDFHVNDYNLLTSVYGVKIDGIIGYSFLRRYIVSIDYDDSLISVYSPGMMKYPKGGYMLKPNFTSIPMQMVFLKDDKRSIDHRYYFDTGAGLCFLVTEDFAQDSSLFAKNKKMLPTLAEGLGGKRPMNITILKQVKLGPFRFKKVPTYVFKDEFNVTSYPNTGGLIGNDLLRRFNVILNYPEQQIHIKPNKSFDHPFDYSYTGMGIYLENGEIIVDDVIKGSPGDKAGFKTGDKIIGVAGNFSNNIQTYKMLLQNAETKIPVIVMRDGVATMLNLKVRNILERK